MGKCVRPSKDDCVSYVNKYDDPTSQRELIPNPDIAGIGVTQPEIHMP